MIDKLYLAKPRGFCAGVVMAIEAVERSANEMRDENQGELTKSAGTGDWQMWNVTFDNSGTTRVLDGAGRLSGRVYLLPG